MPGKFAFDPTKLVCAAGFLLAGCGQHYTVTRIVDGRAQEGPFVEPAAYAAYLRGAIAEGHGDFRGALHEYEVAAKVDDADPEIWTRIAATRCALNPNDLQARVALRQALIRDEDYAPAWEVRASCEITRGVDRVDVERSAARAVEIDPRSTKAQTLVAQVEEQRDAQVARRRLLALTLVSASDANAWVALGTWGSTHGDSDLEMRSFSRVTDLAPTQWNRVAAAVLSLAGDGELREARSLAGKLADAQRRVAEARAAGTFSVARFPLVARLAVDDAVVAKDGDAMRSRASIGHVPLEEVAARATLLGETALARELAEEIVRSDPQNFEASLVLTAVDPTRVNGAAPDAKSTISAATFFAIASSRAPLDLTNEPIFDGDSLVNEIAAKLAASGRVDSRKLSAEAEIELAVRTGKAPQLSKGIDARHRFLQCAFQSPTSTTGCEALTRHFSALGSRDLFVNVALAHFAIAAGSATEELANRIRLLGPNDPLATTTANAIHAHLAGRSVNPT